VSKRPAIYHDCQLYPFFLHSFLSLILFFSLSIPNFLPSLHCLPFPTLTPFHSIFHSPFNPFLYTSFYFFLLAYLYSIFILLPLHPSFPFPSFPRFPFLLLFSPFISLFILHLTSLSSFLFPALCLFVSLLASHGLQTLHHGPLTMRAAPCIILCLFLLAAS